RQQPTEPSYPETAGSNEHHIRSWQRQRPQGGSGCEPRIVGDAGATRPVDAARCPDPMMRDSLDRLAAEQAPVVVAGHGPGHVVAGGRNEIDGPATLDEPGKVAAMPVDTGRARRRCVLVHAQESTRPN